MKVGVNSLRTKPLVMVSRLSAVVLVPACTPNSVRGLVVAVTCSAVAGAAVPMPSRLLVASQKRLALFWDSNPPVPMKGTEPAVNDENKGAEEKVLAPAIV